MSLYHKSFSEWERIRLAYIERGWIGKNSKQRHAKKYYKKRWVFVMRDIKIPNEISFDYEAIFDCSRLEEWKNSLCSKI
jgi:hypothetical protein